MRRNVLYGMAILLLILLITNPGLDEFKSYLHKNQRDNPAGRDTNFFIFSIYSNIGDHIDAPHNGHIIKYNYLGVLGNFFPIGFENVY